MIAAVYSARRGPAWSVIVDEHPVLAVSERYVATEGRRLERAPLELHGRTWHAPSRRFFATTREGAGMWGSTPSKTRRPLSRELVEACMGVEIGMWEHEEALLERLGYVVDNAASLRIVKAKVLSVALSLDTRRDFDPRSVHRRAIDSRWSVERLVEAWTRQSLGVSDEHVIAAARVHHELVHALLVELGVPDILGEKLGASARATFEGAVLQ